MGYKIAIAGATGNVGRQFLSILEERKFPADEIIPLASRNSAGQKVSFGSKELTVQCLDDYDFTGTHIGLFSPGSSVSKIHAPRAAAAGCVVIDNTSQFRMDKDIPLVVPEVNAHALEHFRKRNIIANPNCSTIQMVVALKPLHDAGKIKRVIVSTYQSVSGAGKKAMDELYLQTKKKYVFEEPNPEVFTKQIAFNAIPQIDIFMEDGFTKEEWKMRVETQKILGANIEVNATCVRVPVFVGHAESVFVEFENALSAELAREILEDAPGVVVADRPDQPGGYATQVEAAGEDAVYVSRIRQDATQPNSLNMWIVADNVRKGAALNAIQIAETLIEQYGL